MREFAEARDWGQFHTPRGLVLAIVGVVGELAELFQWLTDEEALWLGSSAQGRDRIEEELADVFAYLVWLADVLEVDLALAVEKMVVANEARYPIDLASGNARKYDELGER